jgi:hypothetical protein
MSDDWVVVDVWLADLQTPVHLSNLEPAQTFGQKRNMAGSTKYVCEPSTMRQDTLSLWYRCFSTCENDG